MIDPNATLAVAPNPNLHYGWHTDFDTPAAVQYIRGQQFNDAYAWMTELEYGIAGLILLATVLLAATHFGPGIVRWYRDRKGNL